MNRFVCFAGAQPDILCQRVTLPDLPEGLDGKSVLFLSDIHFGAWFNDNAARTMVNRMETAAPDLILYGGDFADRAKDAQALFTHLSHLRPPLGALAVPGNNDFEAFEGDYSVLRRRLRDAGIKLLVNRRFELPVPGGRLIVTGLDDAKRGKPDPGIAHVRRKPGDFHMLLTHSPWLFRAALDKQNTVDLALAGHTHAGQIAPFGLSVYSLGFERKRRMRRENPYYLMAGSKVVEGTRLMVTNGVGESLLPIRVGAPPQMHLLLLKKG